MKDQYVGDINDYFKYALLRTLQARRKYNLQVCWMLTAADGRTDGSRTSYLDDAARFRPVDPGLFDALGALVRENDRSTAGVRRAGVLPRADFHEGLMPQEKDARAHYFAEVAQRRSTRDLVFFDPDNGIEVKSVPRGRQNSTKYLFWDELTATMTLSRSALIYQHCPRENRAAFTSRIMEALRGHLPSHSVMSVRGAHVLFLVAAADHEVDELSRGIIDLAERWPVELKTQV